MIESGIQHDCSSLFLAWCYSVDSCVHSWARRQPKNSLGNAKALLSNWYPSSKPSYPQGCLPVASCSWGQWLLIEDFKFYECGSHSLAHTIQGQVCVYPIDHFACYVWRRLIMAHLICITHAQSRVDNAVKAAWSAVDERSVRCGPRHNLADCCVPILQLSRVFFAFASRICGVRPLKKGCVFKIDRMQICSKTWNIILEIGKGDGERAHKIICLLDATGGSKPFSCLQEIWNAVRIGSVVIFTICSITRVSWRYEAAI